MFWDLLSPVFARHDSFPVLLVIYWSVVISVKNLEQSVKRRILQFYVYTLWKKLHVIHSKSILRVAHKEHTSVWVICHLSPYVCLSLFLSRIWSRACNEESFNFMFIPCGKSYMLYILNQSCLSVCLSFCLFLIISVRISSRAWSEESFSFMLIPCENNYIFSIQFILTPPPPSVCLSVCPSDCRYFCQESRGAHGTKNPSILYWYPVKIVTHCPYIYAKYI